VAFRHSTEFERVEQL